MLRRGANLPLTKTFTEHMRSGTPPAIAHPPPPPSVRAKGLVTTLPAQPSVSQPHQLYFHRFTVIDITTEESSSGVGHERIADFRCSRKPLCPLCRPSSWACVSAKDRASPCHLIARSGGWARDHGAVHDPGTINPRLDGQCEGAGSDVSCLPKCTVYDRRNAQRGHYLVHPRSTLNSFLSFLFHPSSPQLHRRRSLAIFSYIDT